MIGLGRMGLPMSKNLAKKFQVLTFDKTQKNQMKIAETFAKSDVVVIALPRASDVESVLEGGLNALKPGSLLIDTTTVSTDFAQRVGELALKHKVLAVDAPMSGGQPRAISGKLTFMVGGSSRAFEAAKPILEAMGERIFYAGEKGAGASVKLCNNLMLASQMIAVAEGFALAKKLHLDAASLYEIASNSTAKSWSLNEYPPVPDVGSCTSPANSKFEPGFSASLMLKDLSIARQVAINVDSPTPLADKSAYLYDYMVHRADLGQLDFSAIIQLIQNNYPDL